MSAPGMEDVSGDAWNLNEGVPSVDFSSNPNLPPNPNIPADANTPVHLTQGQIAHMLLTFGSINDNANQQRLATETQTQVLQSLYGHIQQLQAQQQAQHVPSQAASAARIPPKPTFKEPAPFTGKPTEVESFISEIQNAVQLQRFSLTTEEDKALVMNSYLAEGTPKQWFRGVQKFNAHLLRDFDDLITAFRNHFGSTNLSYEYSRKLEALKQTGSCASYAARFVEMVAYVDWSEQTKIDNFYNGLKEEVKDALSYISRVDLPDQFDAFMTLAIQKDNRVHERQKERKQSKNSASNSSPSSHAKPNQPSSRTTTSVTSDPAPTPSSSTTTTTLSPGVPMEIDATRTSKPRGPLTAAERQHRRDHNLCLYCGGAGHGASNCPNMSDAAKKKFAEKKKAAPSSGKA